MTRTAAKPSHRFAGTHVDDLADGRILVPGELYTLTPDDLKDPHNQRLVDEGLLVTVEHGKKED